MTMNINALLPLILGMNGNGNVNEALIKILTDSMSGSQSKLDPSAIMTLALLSSMSKNNAKPTKTTSDKNDENYDNAAKTPDMSAIENLSNGNITEILKMMINNQNK